MVLKRLYSLVVMFATSAVVVGFTATSALAIPKPNAPSGLAATVVSSSQINLSWTDNSDNESGFVIERFQTSVGTYVQAGTVGPNIHTFSDTGRSPSTAYTYHVYAYNSAGNSANSANVSATTSASTADTTPPSVPTGLTAGAISSSSVVLGWNASTDTGGAGLFGYNIYRNGAKIAATQSLSYTDTGRSPNTQYCYTVAAYDNASNLSAKSAQVCATTPATTDTTAPSVPTGLTAAAASSSQINLSWNASTDTGGAGLAGYNVYRNGVKITSTTARTYSDTGRTAGTQYCYTVAAYDNSSNLSAQSGQICATTSAASDTTAPTVPGGLTATAASSSQVNLSWAASSDTGGSGLAGYKVYRSGTQIATTSSTSYSDTGRTAGTQYCYTVAAYDGAGNNSSQSGSSCATTPSAADTTAPTVPSGLTASAASSSQVNLSWSASSDSGGSGLAGYRVYRSGVLIATTSVTSFADTGRTAGTQYCYTVASYDNAGNSSAQTGSACATTTQAVAPPATTSLVGFISAVGGAHQVIVTNNIAYVASDNFGLALANVANPAAPVMLSSASQPFDGIYVAVRGTIACATGQRQYYIPMGQPDAGSLTNVFGFYVFDVSVPTNCVLLGKIESDSVGFKGVAISGNYAYVATGATGVKVINIATPSSPAFAGTGYDTPGWANSVTINGNYAYVADSTQGLRILNISNPLAPTSAGSVDTPGTANHVSLYGNYAYVSDLSSLQIIDVSNPSSPVIRGSFSATLTGGSFVESRVVGNTAYVAGNGAGLVTVNVGTPSLPSLLSSILTAPNGTVSVAMQGSYAFLANQDAGLSIVNVTNPLSLLTSGNLSEWFQGNYMSAKPGIAVVTGLHAWDAGRSTANGLRVLNTSNYRAPKIVGAMDSTTVGFNGLCVTGNYAYVACGGSGLKVVDITNPAAPAFVGTGYDTPGWANSVTVSGGYAYVADGAQGLRIISISNPLAPTQTGYVDTPGTAYSVAISGNYAYVADSGSVQIIDITNKSAPVVRGSYTTATTGGTFLDVKVSGTTAYVAGNGAGLVILNVSNPAAPTLLSKTITGPNGTIGVNLNGTTAYVANQDYGVTQINVANPSAPVAGASVLSVGSVRNIVLDGGWLCSSDSLSTMDTIQLQ